MCVHGATLKHTHGCQRLLSTSVYLWRAGMRLLLGCMIMTRESRGRATRGGPGTCWPAQTRARVRSSMRCRTFVRSIVGMACTTAPAAVNQNASQQQHDYVLGLRPSLFSPISLIGRHLPCTRKCVPVLRTRTPCYRAIMRDEFVGTWGKEQRNIKIYIVEFQRFLHT